MALRQLFAVTIDAGVQFFAQFVKHRASWWCALTRGPRGYDERPQGSDGPNQGGVDEDAAKAHDVVAIRMWQLDRGEGLGMSALIFDGLTGAVNEEHVHGKGTVGDTVLEIQFTLHSGRIAGLPGRIFICVVGLLVAGLSATGVLMWTRRRRAHAQLRAAS